MTTDIAFLSALDLAARYADGSLSPVEATRDSLDRIAAIDPAINAFCLVDAESALADARRSEDRWRRGAPLGPLDGVPTTIKDIVLTRGWPTLRGSKTIDPDQPWDEDGPAVARLREAGAVLLGKTTTPEFAAKAVTESPLTGITRNPWNPEVTPGGSSGGAGAALAAGLCHLALGTDAGGSIRIPASFSGVFGIKPTFGRVPVYPPTPYATFASFGPMTRTVADAAAMLTVISRPDSRDWTALPFDDRDYGDGLDDGVAGLRIAYSADFGYARVDPQVAALVESAARAFAELGATVEAADPGFDDPTPIRRGLWQGATALAFRDMDEEKLALMDPDFAPGIRGAKDYPLLDYMAADMARNALGRHMCAFHQQFDLLLSPVTAVPPFPVGRAQPDGFPAGDTAHWVPFCFPFNLTRQPAASVPCGFTESGLPVGLHIVGPLYADALVLRAARAFERARPWAHHRPALADGK
ncbi:MAG: amidase [Hyphomicrobiales bacterium]|nr:amidase [Hyphomicrobiales bacterium]MCP5372276.1 amidase [Hyphomicrobiales bacterium]